MQFERIGAIISLGGIVPNDRKEVHVMPRMRLIAEAYNEIKKDDPNTAITLSGLRNLVRQGKIPCTKIGRKTLINYDALIEYLSINV